MSETLYQDILNDRLQGKKALAVLVDPEKFIVEQVSEFLQKLPTETTHFFVGGSTVLDGQTERVVKALKRSTSLPVILFPGSYEQITEAADGILFLSLLSGRNPDYLIGQQVKAVPFLTDSSLEIIPTAYVLIDGGQDSAVARVSKTSPIQQTQVETILNTALAGQYMGAKMIYLEAGSGAKTPVAAKIISKVKKAIKIPLLVGGGIRTEEQRLQAYDAGADLVVMGTVFEEEKKIKNLSQQGLL